MKTIISSLLVALFISLTLAQQPGDPAIDLKLAAEYTGVTLALDDRRRHARNIKQLREKPQQLKTLVRSSASH